MFESEYKLWLYNIVYFKFFLILRFSYRGYYGVYEVFYFGVCDYGDIEIERNYGKY